MKKKKLILINPVNFTRKGFLLNKAEKNKNGSMYQPLGLGIVAALTSDNWEVEILDEVFIPFEYKEADLVGLTAFTSSVLRAYEIAGIYKEKGIPTVLGGIHASMVTDEALNYVDTVVIGEAESVWKELISDFENGRMKKIYKGIHIELKNSVKPRRELFNKNYIFGSIQTSRGCPMNCDFCSVTSFNGGDYRQRPINEILDELETIPQKYVFFVDDNIIGYGKNSQQRAIELFKGMIKRKLKKEWFSQASLNFADNDEVLKYARKSGCRLILMGIESEKEEDLKEIDKKLNLKKGVENYKKIFKKIQRHGICVLGTFIYGLDNDSIEDLDRRTEFILKSGVDAVQTSILTPLPGTRLYKRALKENRIFKNNYPEDWRNYHFIVPVMHPKNMTYQELHKSMYKQWYKLYDKKTLIIKAFRTAWNMRNFNLYLWAARGFNGFFWAYYTNLSYRNIMLEDELFSKKK